ncbi:MAG: putative Calnexin [Streblomastix strix]|uniref:Putative Calnexin n=1 Tax=Streblomastix strix TaxID=222440 RepID=A0A5J4V8Q4_9EUKA|nr:MAG: putative Calnexin [Streblomastix strix]
MHFIILIAILQLVHSEPYIFENFENQDVDDRWINTQNGIFRGKWEIERLVTKTTNSFSAISLKSEFEAVGGPLIFQFQLKVQETPFECGGAYMKILQENFSPGKFDNSTNYHIMFGPDRCGLMNKIHFILKVQNPKTSIWTEHQLLNPPSALWDQFTHIYTLIITESDDFKILIDGKLKRFGSLHNSSLFIPPFEPAELIIDQNDTKPLGWDDESQLIPDPQDLKPDNWDENQPMRINDPSIKKPSDWDEDEPLKIPDPNAKKPKFWEDKELESRIKWTPPMIRNPKCRNHGCGPWKPPTIPNPNYRGKWKPKLIPNPEFKGEWKPTLIKNPAYYKPSDLHNIGKCSGIGIDIMVGNTTGLHFSNILVTNSLDDQNKALEDIWRIRHKKEYAIRGIPEDLDNDNDELNKKNKNKNNNQNEDDDEMIDEDGNTIPKNPKNKKKKQNKFFYRNEYGEIQTIFNNRKLWHRFCVDSFGIQKGEWFYDTSLSTISFIDEHRGITLVMVMMFLLLLAVPVLMAVQTKCMCCGCCCPCCIPEDERRRKQQMKEDEARIIKEVEQSQKKRRLEEDKIEAKKAKENAQKIREKILKKRKAIKRKILLQKIEREQRIKLGMDKQDENEEENNNNNNELDTYNEKGREYNKLKQLYEEKQIRKRIWNQLKDEKRKKRNKKYQSSSKIQLG